MIRTLIPHHLWLLLINLKVSFALQPPLLNRNVNSNKSSYVINKYTNNKNVKKGSQIKLSLNEVDTIISNENINDITKPTITQEVLVNFKPNMYSMIRRYKNAHPGDSQSSKISARTKIENPEIEYNDLQFLDKNKTSLNEKSQKNKRRTRQDRK